MIDRPWTAVPRLNLRKGIEQLRFAKVDTLVVTDRREKNCWGCSQAGHPSQRYAQRSPPWARSWSLLHPRHPGQQYSGYSSPGGRGTTCPSSPSWTEAGSFVRPDHQSSLMTTLSHQYLDTERQKEGNRGYGFYPRFNQLLYERQGTDHLPAPGTHQLTAIAVGVAILIGVPLGILICYIRKPTRSPSWERGQRDSGRAQHGPAGLAIPHPGHRHRPRRGGGGALPC